MYSYIKGTLVQSTSTFAILDTHGIGYKIFIPTSVFSKLPPLHDSLLLHTSFIVRELAHTLYGFLTPEDRNLFEALMDVTGVGPKMALSIIGHLTSFELHQAITNHDIPTLSKVPGIGKKTAERLIIEMRDKISSLLPITPADFQTRIDPNAQKISDAMSALINLGYSQATAQKAIKKCLKDAMAPESMELSELIASALKCVM